MKKREASFTTNFLALSRTVFRAPCVFEIKDTRGKDVFYLRELKVHQRHALLAARLGKFPYKISDSTIGYRPFDAVLFGNMPAYLIVKYPKRWYAIPIEKVPEEGVLSEADAWALSTRCG